MNNNKIRKIHFDEYGNILSISLSEVTIPFSEGGKSRFEVFPIYDENGELKSLMQMNGDMLISALSLENTQIASENEEAVLKILLETGSPIADPRKILLFYWKKVEKKINELCLAC